MALRHRLTSSLACLVAAAPLVAMAQEAPRPNIPAGMAERPNQVRGDELTPEAQAAIDRGLEWLAKRQKPDGSFGSNDSYGSVSAVTALSGLAFMSAGHLPGRGKYGQNVQRAVDYLVNNAQESGLLAAESAHGVMYSHGFATLFLGEVYGMTGDERVKEKLQKAVRLIHRSQNPEGGWRYMPVPYDADISVTICEVMGLRAARDAGIKVEKEVIDKAIAYVRRCRNPDGGFSYIANAGGGGGSAFERSAAGVATLYYAGIFDGDELKSGLDYIAQFQPGQNKRSHSHYYYGHYYAAQAMFLAGGDYWKNWYPAVRDELIKVKQQPDGSFTGEVNAEYCTACALIILQMPNRYLPVFNGKGPGG